MAGYPCRGSDSVVTPPYYDEDGITLYHGDASEILPGDLSVDAVVTDPPYKLSQEYGTSTDPDNLVAVASIWPVMRLAYEATRPGGLLVAFYDTRILPLAMRAIPDAGWRYLRALTLYRRWGQASVVSGWMSTSDFALVFHKPGAKPEFHGQVHHDTFVKAAPDGKAWDHPAQKPLELVRQIVERVTPPGGVVLDPYAGSGTTLEAARTSGRRAIGVELEKRHCETVAQRLGTIQLTLGEAA